MRNNATLTELAKKYNKTFSHIMLRWQIQRGFILLPKSVTPKRIISNGDLFDFELTEDDMAKLNDLGKENFRVCWNPLNEPWDDNYNQKPTKKKDEEKKNKEEDLDQQIGDALDEILSERYTDEEAEEVAVNKKLGEIVLKFNDGNVIPQVGLGTFLLSRTRKYFRKKDVELSAEQIEQDKKDDAKEEKEFRDAVLSAVRCGYRHIDTAQGIDYSFYHFYVLCLFVLIAFFL